MNIMNCQQIIEGDSLKIMKQLKNDTIDLIVTDPPYGYNFMGKDWDKAVPSVEIWKECLRVLKSGAFAFIMSAPRQDVFSHMIMHLERAGFNINFTSIYWAYATGFPKAMNISKAIYKKGVKVTEPASEQAKALDGSYGGFQPKPAVEIIIVCMKPLTEKTFVDQALMNGHGVTWLDNARIPCKSYSYPKGCGGAHGSGEIYGIAKDDMRKKPYFSKAERFPANLICQDDVLNDEKITVSIGGQANNQFRQIHNIYGKGIENKQSIDVGYGNSGSFSRYFDLDAWWNKTIKTLPEAVQKTFPFLICPKAGKGERNKGLEDLPNRKVEASHGNVDGSLNSDGKPSLAKNFHPTVKPLKLMSYLLTLGSRPNDMVLDPFVGSGTTCIAAKLLNRNCIGIEINPKYVKIAQKRLDAIQEGLEKWL